MTSLAKFKYASVPLLIGSYATIGLPCDGASVNLISLGMSVLYTLSLKNPLISSTTEGLEVNRRKCIVAQEENGQTSKKGVFAGGDAVTGAATVILAMGAGKAAAKGIDEFLS